MMINHSQIQDNRHATWLELFFDLIFVVAIAKASHALLHTHHGHIEGVTYLKYILIMVPIWWAWTGCTLYSSRFDCDDVLHRLLIFCQIFCIILLAAHINIDFDTYYRGFLFSYIGIRSVTILMYLRASLQKSASKHVSNFLATAFAIGVLISLSSLFFDGVLRYLMFYAGIGFDMIVPLTAKRRLQTVSVNAHHLPERFGLLTIILLGESVLSLSGSFEILKWSTSSIAMACCGFIITCAIWWLYFENIERRLAGQVKGHGQQVIYSHLFIYTGLGGIAAMIRFAVIPELSLLDFKMIAGSSLLSFLVALQFLHYVYDTLDLRKWLLFNGLLFNGLLLTLLLYSSSIVVIVGGITFLISVYAVVDSLLYRHKSLQQRI